MMGCLTWPVRVVATLLLIGLIYLGWINRDLVRRWVHRATAEKVVPEPTPAESRARMRARLDSVARRRVDSVILTPDEAEQLVLANLPPRATAVVDSLDVELGDGSLTLRGQIDGDSIAKMLPGPIASALGRRPGVALRGPIQLVRTAVGEWRIEDVSVRGVPLPRAVWGKVLEHLGSTSASSINFKLPAWVSGFRVSRKGVVVFGSAR